MRVQSDDVCSINRLTFPLSATSKITTNKYSSTPASPFERTTFPPCSLRARAALRFRPTQGEIASPEAHTTIRPHLLPLARSLHGRLSQHRHVIPLHRSLMFVFPSHRAPRHRRIGNPIDHTDIHSPDKPCTSATPKHQRGGGARSLPSREPPKPISNAPFSFDVAPLHPVLPLSRCL